MHRPRRRAAVLSDIRQSWVPRVVNLTFGGLLLLFLVPLWAKLPDLVLSVQVLLVLLAVPLSLLAAGLLISAARPGALSGLRRRKD